MNEIMGQPQGAQASPARVAPAGVSAVSRPAASSLDASPEAPGLGTSAGSRMMRAFGGQQGACGLGSAAVPEFGAPASAAAPALAGGSALELGDLGPDSLVLEDQGGEGDQGDDIGPGDSASQAGSRSPPRLGPIALYDQINTWPLIVYYRTSIYDFTQVSYPCILV